MRSPLQGPRLEDVAVAALVLQAFTLYLLVLTLVSHPSATQWAHADPILTLLPRQLTLWSAPATGLAFLLGWWRWARPTGEALRSGARDAALGVAAACAIALSLRLVVGPSLPGFIPPEESAGPGFLLSMTAGYEEEVLCRLGVLPLVYFALHGRAPRWAAIASSVIATGLVFAAWHALGEPEPSTTFFLTRLLIPGCVMSVVWLASPSAIVAAHCTAHLLIPALFTS